MSLEASKSKPRRLPVDPLLIGTPRLASHFGNPMIANVLFTGIYSYDIQAEYLLCLAFEASAKKTGICKTGLES